MYHHDVDKGYAWVICATSFFAHIFQYGVVWTVGVFYAVFVEVFEGSRGAIALITSLNTAVYYMTGPIASLLTNRYGPRVVAMSGGLIGSLGLILSMYATNIYHLYATFGFLTGFGFGIAYIPSITVVGHYFDKWRTIALGLAVSGCGIGTFLFPPMLRFFIDHYGWRGALLLTGGVCLHLCVCGAMMRPMKLDHLGQAAHAPEKKSKNKQLSNSNIRLQEASTNNVNDTVNEASVNNVKDENEKNMRYSQLQNGCVAEEKKQFIENQNVEQNNKEKLVDCKAFWKLLNLHIFKNKSYIMLCLNNFFFTFGLSIIYVHLASYAASIGFSDNEGALLFSALGIANFAGRIAFGFLAHMPCVSPISLYCVVFFLVGAATEFCPLLASYAALLAYAVVFGFLSASLGTLLPAVIMDILDVQLLSSGYGYVLMFEAAGTLSGAPVAGWVYDSTGIYKTSFYLGGAAIMTSSLLMTYPWFCDLRLQQKELRKGNEQSLSVLDVTLPVLTIEEIGKNGHLTSSLNSVV